MISLNKKSPRNGFALIELLFVLLVICTLLIFCVDEYMRHLENTRITRARTDIDELIKAIRLYNIRENDRFDVKVFSTAQLGSFIGNYLDKEPPLDPWGNYYRHSPDMGIVYSLGPDRKDQMTVAGEADSDDISECYIPKELFITKAQYIDVNGNNVANDFGDYIELTFSRPVFLEEPIGLDFETSNPEKALGTVDIKAEKDPFKARITLIPPIVSHIVIGETCIFPREFIESIYDRSPAHQRLQKFDNMKIEKRKNGM